MLRSTSSTFRTSSMPARPQPQLTAALFPTQTRLGHNADITVRKLIDKYHVADLRRDFRIEIGNKYSDRLRRKVVEHAQFRKRVEEYRKKKQVLKENRMEQHKRWMEALKKENDQKRKIRANNRKFMATMWAMYLRHNLVRMTQEHRTTGYIIEENLDDGISDAAVAVPPPENIFGLPVHSMPRKEVMEDDLEGADLLQPDGWSTEYDLDSEGQYSPAEFVMFADNGQTDMEYGYKLPADMVYDYFSHQKSGGTPYEHMPSEVEMLEDDDTSLNDPLFLARAGIDPRMRKYSKDFKLWKTFESEGDEDRLARLFNEVTGGEDSPFGEITESLDEDREKEIDELFDTLKSFSLGKEE